MSVRPGPFHLGIFFFLPDSIPLYPDTSVCRLANFFNIDMTTAHQHDTTSAGMLTQSKHAVGDDHTLYSPITTFSVSKVRSFFLNQGRAHLWDDSSRRKASLIFTLFFFSPVILPDTQNSTFPYLTHDMTAEDMESVPASLIHHQWYWSMIFSFIKSREFCYVCHTPRCRTSGHPLGCLTVLRVIRSNFSCFLAIHCITSWSRVYLCSFITQARFVPRKPRYKQPPQRPTF